MTRLPPTPIGPDFNPGGARWCTEHGEGVANGGRLECTKNRSKGRGVCHAIAIRGTDACGIHSGKTKAVAKSQGAAKISAWSALGDAGQTVDYKMAVLGVLQMSWLRLAAYSELLRRQVMTDGDTAEGIDQRSDESPDTSGLIGFRYGAAGRDGNIFAQSEDVRALVNLEASERDRVVKYAKTAHDMGISDRLTNLAERWGDVVATRITIMFDELDLSPDQQAKVPTLIQAHLGSIDMGSMGAGDGR